MTVQVGENHQIFTAPTKVRGMDVPRVAESLMPATDRQARTLTKMDRKNNYESGARRHSPRSVMSHMTHAGFYKHFGKLGRAKKNMHTWAIRPPTALEQASALSVAARLERLEVEGKAVSRSWSELPPGRLDFRRDRTRRLARAAGQVSTVKTFERRKVQHAPKTKIKVGVLLDISASMDTHAALGASLAWVLAQATKRVRGEVAVVAASDITQGYWPLLAPNESQAGVTVVDTNAGSHDMDSGLLALDGALNLIESDGARLLVVFSDGQFDQRHTSLLPLMGEAGVQVLWVEPPQIYSPSFMRPRQFFSQCEVKADESYTEALEHITSALESAVRRDKGLKGAVA